MSLSFLIIAILARTSPLPSAAQAAGDRAVEEARASNWDAALDDIDTSLRLAPDWGEGFFIRAGVNASKTGISNTKALEAEPESFPFRAFARDERRAAEDLHRYLELVPGAPDRSQVEATLQVLAELAQRAEQLQAAVESRAREARAAEHEHRSHATAYRRHAGMLFVGGAGVLAAAAGAFAALGAGTNSQIKAGGFGTPSDITGVASDGQTFNALALGCGLGAGALAIVGGAFWLLNPDPPPLAAAVAPVPGGATLQVVWSVR